MTNSRERFEALYGARGERITVASWDIRLSVWNNAFKAGRESMRDDAIYHCKISGGKEMSSWQKACLTMADEIKEIQP